LAQEKVRTWRPIVLCSEIGWLTQECERLAIPCIVTPFPRSRSFIGRVYQISAFVREVCSKLEAASILPTIIHANDHWEGILGIRLASSLHARSAIFLRTSRLTEQQYYKYRCNEFDVIAAIGEQLRAKTQSWDAGNEIKLIFDGIGQDEFCPPKPKPLQRPTRILAIGAKRASKGWADLVAALGILEKNNGTRPDIVDFTGELPSREENDIKREHLTATTCNFLGHVDRFRELVLRYDLVINPSRTDSFGMAAVEVLAAGVPLLSSRTGVLGEIIDKEYMLFPPSQPEALASAIANILDHWGDLDFGVKGAQENIRARFMACHSADMVDALYKSLASR
jgi:glycosyltransferase involved in cell wall biosynthesis